MQQLPVFKFNQIKKIVLFNLIFFSVFLFLAGQVSATTIFSPLLELEIDPGNTENGIVKVFNETDEDIYLTSSVEGFTAGDEAGQPIYMPQDEKNDYLNWFELSQQDILLKPNQVGIIPFIVSIPQDAVPGGYYSVIFWKNVAEPNTDKPMVGVSSKVGTLVFLKVSGEIIEQGEVLEFITSQKKNYFSGLPISFLMRFENNGNVHLRPNGSIEIRGLFSRAILPVNDLQRNVLPNSIRQFEFV